MGLSAGHGAAEGDGAAGNGAEKSTEKSTEKKSAMTLLAPLECQQTDSVSRYLTELLHDDQQPISSIAFVDLKQSMANGGGPACLRLRVPMTRSQLADVNPAFLLDETAIDALEEWVKRYYRDRLTPGDLADPALLTDSRAAFEALERLICSLEAQKNAPVRLSPG